MSTSPARLAANAANAQFSTGPRTSEGKSRSSQNASKHGLTAREVVIAPGEQEVFDALLAGLETDVQPQGAIQQTLFNQLVAAAWNLRRVRLLEADPRHQDNPAELDRLARHHTRIERTFCRCLKHLQALQTNAFIQASLIAPLRKYAPPLASASEIAKRTQCLQQHDPLMIRDLLKALQGIPPTQTAKIEPDLHLTANAI
jgi:hypothetical protein